MIEILSGILKIKHPTFAVIDCNGVGLWHKIENLKADTVLCVEIGRAHV